MGNVISGGGKYFAGKFKLGKIEDQILAGDPKAGFGPSKPCPPDTDCSEDEKSIENYKQDQDLVFNNQALNEVTVSAPPVTNEKSKNKKEKSIYKTKVTGINAPTFGRSEAFQSSIGYSRIDPFLKKKTVKRSQKQIDRMKKRGITFTDE
jgi:hypothetical protein